MSYGTKEFVEALAEYFPDDDLSGDGPWRVRGGLGSFIELDGHVALMGLPEENDEEMMSVVPKTHDPLEDISNLLYDNTVRAERNVAKVKGKLGQA